MTVRSQFVLKSIRSQVSSYLSQFVLKTIRPKSIRTDFGQFVINVRSSRPIFFEFIGLSQLVLILVRSCSVWSTSTHYGDMHTCISLWVYFKHK